MGKHSMAPLRGGVWPVLRWSFQMARSGRADAGVLFEVIALGWYVGFRLRRRGGRGRKRDGGVRSTSG